MHRVVPLKLLNMKSLHWIWYHTTSQFWQVLIVIILSKICVGFTQKITMRSFWEKICVDFVLSVFLRFSGSMIYVNLMKFDFFLCGIGFFLWKYYFTMWWIYIHLFQTLCRRRPAYHRDHQPTTPYLPHVGIKILYLPIPQLMTTEASSRGETKRVVNHLVKGCLRIKGPRKHLVHQILVSVKLGFKYIYKVTNFQTVNCPLLAIESILPHNISTNLQPSCGGKSYKKCAGFALMVQTRCTQAGIGVHLGHNSTVVWSLMNVQCLNKPHLLNLHFIPSHCHLKCLIWNFPHYSKPCPLSGLYKSDTKTNKQTV